MKKTIIILICIFQSILIYSQNIRIVNNDFVGEGFSSNSYIIRDTDKKFYLYNYINDEKLPINFDYEGPVLDTYFPDNEDIFYLVIGGNSAMDAKDIIEFDIDSLNIDWGYRFPGDFMTNFSSKNNHLYTTMRNNGVAFDFDIEESEVQYVKCYDSAIYHVYKIDDNEIFTCGANNYKENDFGIKILDNELKVINEFKGFSESYVIKHNNNGLLLLYSTNQYLDPDNSVHIYDYSMNEIASIEIEDSIKAAAFSVDGESILVGHGYSETSMVSKYTLDGHIIKKSQIETDDTYLRIVDIKDFDNEIIVVLGKSER